MTQKEYKIEEERMDKLYNLAEEINANISLIKMFCDQNKDCDELYKIIPILNMTHKNSDVLYAECINLKYAGVE